MLGTGVMAAAAAAATLTVLVWLARKSIGARGVKMPGPRWLERFDARRYRPAERLISASDLEFLPLAPGYTPEIERRLRAARRRVLAGYLRWMRADFDRLYVAGKAMAAAAETDQTDVVVALVRMRMVFLWRYAVAMGRLRLAWAGAAMPDVRTLAGAVARLGGTVRSMTPAQARV
jgi:hypothetical protein